MYLYKDLKCGNNKELRGIMNIQTSNGLLKLKYHIKRNRKQFIYALDLK